MADPRQSAVFEMTADGPKPRQANHSPLMKALSRAKQGEVVNACRWASETGGWEPCADDQLDSQGYCKHMIGVTNDIDAQGKRLHGAKYEPVVRSKGRRSQRIMREKVLTGHDDDGKPEYELGAPQLVPVLKSDVLVQITCSARVYRDVDAAALEEATRPEPAKKK